MQIYSVGKVPISLMVDGPKIGITLGNSLILSGTVMDISAGTKQKERAAHFPKEYQYHLTIV